MRLYRLQAPAFRVHPLCIASCACCPKSNLFLHFLIHPFTQHVVTAHLVGVCVCVMPAAQGAQGRAQRSGYIQTPCLLSPSVWEPANSQASEFLRQGR